MDVKDLFDGMYILGNTRITQTEVKEDGKVVKPAFIMELKNVTGNIVRNMTKALMTPKVKDMILRTVRASEKQNVNSLFKQGGRAAVDAYIRKQEAKDKNDVLFSDYCSGRSRVAIDEEQVTRSYLADKTPEQVAALLKEMGIKLPK